MKRTIIFFTAIMLLPVLLIAQSATWRVNAIDNGKAFPINVYLTDGTAVPVSAIYEAGNDHFMDVKGVHMGEKISVKIIASEDMLVPVKGISSSGEIFKVKAEDADGNILDVKGVSRDGNTINIAAITMEGKHIPLKAISPTGVEREVKGVRFMRGNVEMEFGNIKVIAHVKALPIIEVGEIDSKWDVKAISDIGEYLSLVAINPKGREYPIKAIMPGKYPYIMNVRAEASIDIFIKLVKNEDGILLHGIDEYGRQYDVRAKTDNGELYKVIGGKTTGNVTPIFVVGPDNKEFPLTAISSEGHQFDVKGIKVKEGDVEGTISGLNVWIKYFAHVKALAPADIKEQ